jgi:thioredoxin-like negative regulator of GroEL
LAKEYVGRVVFAKVNIDENHLTATSLVFKVFQQRRFLKNGKIIDVLISALL